MKFSQFLNEYGKLESILLKDVKLAPIGQNYENFCKIARYQIKRLQNKDWSNFAKLWATL